jgi:hypothetical protein
MLCREIIAVCSEIHTRHINTPCGQNVEFVNVKPSGTYLGFTELGVRKLQRERVYKRRFVGQTQHSNRSRMM